MNRTESSISVAISHIELYQSQPPSEHKAITSQNQIRSHFRGTGHPDSDYIESNLDSSPSRDYPNTNGNRQNTRFTCTILKRLLSALLIIGDVLIEWVSLADMITGTVSDENSLKQNQDFMFSFPNMDDTKVILVGNGTFNGNCDSSTFQITVSYVGFSLFGTLFALLKLINIIGETIREICDKKRQNKRNDKNETKNKLQGFQLLHGWMETFLALLFEDIPQNSLIVLYSMTCKRNALNKTKTAFSIMGSLVKNVVRKVTCKQKKMFACVYCHYSIDIGCMCCTCLSCVICSCCGPLKKLYPAGSEVIVNGKRTKIENFDKDCNKCKLVYLDWGCEIEVPPLCSCGQCVIINQKGCCLPEGECCNWVPYKGCCGKKIDKDPIWLEIYITLAYLANIAILVIYLLDISLASVLKL